jgi:hypothetical protein
MIASAPTDITSKIPGGFGLRRNRHRDFLTRWQEWVSTVRYRIEEHYQLLPALLRRVERVPIVAFQPEKFVARRAIAPSRDAIEQLAAMRSERVAYGSGNYVTQLRNKHASWHDWQRIEALLGAIVQSITEENVSVPIRRIEEISAARYDVHDPDFKPALATIEAFEATFEPRFRNISQSRFEALCAEVFASQRRRSFSWRAWSGRLRWDNGSYAHRGSSAIVFARSHNVDDCIEGSIITRRLDTAVLDALRHEVKIFWFSPPESKADGLYLSPATAAIHDLALRFGASVQTLRRASPLGAEKALALIVMLRTPQDRLIADLCQQRVGNEAGEVISTLVRLANTQRSHGFR